jgi:adenylate cyclase
MPATLQIFPASAEPFEIRIGDVASIGRLADSTVCLTSGPAISRQHAVIRSNNGSSYQVVDLGSLNGTYLDGQRVVLPVQLEHGARIQIGDNEIVFQENDESAILHEQSTILGSVSRIRNISSFLALMVCDIRGFTTATETYSKDDLAETLGSWFREVNHLVHSSGGNIDKFIGDGFFAYWVEHQTKGAECTAAFETGRQLLELAQRIKWPDARRPFEIVVTLHCGNVSFGNVGVSAERDASIMGDAVNTVFRLESVAKELNQRLLTTQEIVMMLPETEGFTDLGERTLKGKRNPVRIFGYTP